MKLLMIQPPHAFVEADLPPLPGVSKSHKIMQCKHCGLMGYTPDNVYVHMLCGTGKDKRAAWCDGGQHEGTLCWYARITCPHLYRRGPAFEGLKPGTMHRVVMPPDDDPLTLEGIWVHGRWENVKLLPGEYLPMQVRTRRRVETITVDAPRIGGLHGEDNRSEVVRSAPA